MNLKKNNNKIRFELSDAIQFMQNNVIDESVQLVYLDPPFFSQKIQTQYNKKHSKKISFSDKWNDLDEYLHFIKKILIECKKKMNNSGLIFLHCDASANHYLRLLLDEVFGSNMFLNEIVWVYKRWSNSSKKLLDSHQTIWVYSKTKDYLFNIINGAYSATTNIEQILQQRERNENGTVVYKKNEDNLIIGVNEKKGVPLRDVWEIPFLNPKAKERVGYPTQKPVELLKRIIQISCKENDLILDPFCGSGSLGIAAKIMSCSYIGTDINQDAIEICKKRINNFFISKSKVLDGDYSSFNNLETEIKNFIIDIHGIPVERNKGLDGIFSSALGLIGIKFQRPNESLSEAAKLLKKASYEKPLIKKIIIKTHDDNLFPSEFDDIIIIESIKYQLQKEFFSQMSLVV